MTRFLHTRMGAAFISPIAFLCALVVFTPQAKADIQTIRNSNSEIWGAAGISLFNYQELIPPPSLSDSEHGWVPSLAVGVDYMTAGNWYLAFDSSANFGNAHYNGAYLYFPTTPVEGKSSETITSVDGKVGKGFALGTHVMLTPYGELGFRYWDRNLGAGGHEDYQNFDLLGGLMLQVAPTSKLILTAYGSAGTTLAPQMQTGGYTYNLGTAGMYKIGGKVGYDLTQRLELFTTLDYDAFRYGQSPVQADGTLEPASKTEDTTMRVGLGYHFR